MVELYSQNPTVGQFDRRVDDPFADRAYEPRLRDGWNVPPGPPPLQAGGPQLGAALQSVRRHWSLIVTTTLAVLAAAAIFLVLATPQYTATGLLLIDTKSNAALRSSTPVMTDANVESANIESLIEILKSEKIAKKVVEAENLIDDPALAPGFVGTLVSSIKSLLPIGTTEEAVGENPRLVGAARALQKLTAAKRLGLTYVVEISATMPDRAQSARVTNAFAKAFIDDQMGQREEISRRMSQLLQRRTEELQAKAQMSERAVEQLKFSGSLEGENSASARVTLKSLESSAQAYRLLHDRFLERYAETWQQQFLSLPDAQIASVASPPQSKSSPKTLIILAASIFLGVALGLMRIFIRDRRAIGL